MQDSAVQCVFYRAWVLLHNTDKSVALCFHGKPWSCAELHEVEACAVISVLLVWPTDTCDTINTAKPDCESHLTLNKFMQIQALLPRRETLDSEQWRLCLGLSMGRLRQSSRWHPRWNAVADWTAVLAYKGNESSLGIFVVVLLLDFT